MPGISQKLLKCAPADMNQAGVIAVLKINPRVVRQAVVDKARYYCARVIAMPMTRLLLLLRCPAAIFDAA